MVGNALINQRVLCALALVLSLGVPARAQNGKQTAAQRAAAAHVSPGDKVVLHFLRDRDLSGEVAVNEDGDAAFPKIGLMRVTQLTIGELQDTLRAKYAEFLRVPELEISVLRRITVNGEVRMPNVYMVDGASTVRDVIARAGGITETGNRKNVSIIRDGERIPVKGWEQDESPATDLQSGDQIIVARKSWIVLNALSAISTAILVTSFVISVLR